MGVLHGRAAELALVAETLASAREGRGRAACFTGEAGIGKSSLLAAAREQANGFVVCAGAAWESGGAPPYWPWRSVVRDAVGETSLFEPQESAALDPSAARFALLDGVVRVLVARARERPLLVLLDDLHAADVPTLDLFLMLVRDVPRAAIAVVAAWRESELASRADAAQRLARAARHAAVQPLRRLTIDEIANWIGDGAAAVHATTEGNPLFVEETLRARRAGIPPRAIAHVIEDHLALLSAPARELLAEASVLGRELDAALLPPGDATAATMREAESAGVVERRGKSWAFRHVLLRDHLYDGLLPSRRAALHQRAGEGVARLYGEVAAAHQLLRGTDPPGAIAAARAAAVRATKVFAFEDAVELLEAAVAASPDDLELRVDLADARILAGDGGRAREECVRIAELARATRPELLPRIALVYASEVMTGRRDARMISLLEEALTGLPPGDSSVRARLMARLAAARVPGPIDDRSALALADEAVAMAERVADPETAIYVLRFAGHTRGFRVAIRDHLPIVVQTIELSERLGRPLESLEQRTWLCAAKLAAGDRVGYDAALVQLDGLLANLSQPHYRWRMPLIRSTQALLRGDFVDARRQLAVVEELGRVYDLARPKLSCRMAGISIAAASRDRDYAESLIEPWREHARAIASVSKGGLALALALAGRHAEVRAELEGAIVPGIILSQLAAEAVLVIGDRERAEEAMAALVPALDLYPITAGPAGSLLLRPVALAIGELALLLGRRDEARAYIEQGLALARAIDGVPFIANGEALLAKNGRQDAGEPRSPDSLAIALGAELARVQWRGREVVAPAGKGFEYLAALVATPGREIHVSDLIGDEDRGDAGEVLDARARGEYRERAKELEEELAVARDRNDLGRIQRLTAELEAIADQLVAATGLGGRSRRAGSRVERARVNVQRRIKDAIGKLAREDEALGRYLEATVKTGVFCSYVPV